MPTNQELIEKLKVVIDPEIGMNIVDLGMVKELIVENGAAYVKIALTVSGCPLSGSIEQDVKKALLYHGGINQVVVEMTSMSQEELHQVQQKMQKMQGEKGLPAQKPAGWKLQRDGIKNVVAVMSGKGGVGKSYVTSALAVELRRQGLTVGILDGDLTGPSIAKIFGLSSKPAVDERGAIPVETKTGIKVISMNLLLSQPDTPVIWRGPVIDQAIKQLYTDVHWGELDVLLVDLPPGTGDAPLTVMQALPLAGTVIVSTPQDLAMLIVKKSINMARQLNVPISGIVENMSYMVCPHCSDRIEMFKESGIESEASRLGVNFLGRLPFDPQVNRLADSGGIEEYANETMKEISLKLRESLEKKNDGLKVSPPLIKKS